MENKPLILEVISRYVNLRHQGREFVSLCPFHSEKTPSFSVNPDKEVFHCHGCHEGGDVIHFIEKVEGLDFKGALAHLGLTNQSRPTPEEIKEKQNLRTEAATMTAWALNLSDMASVQMREIGQRGYMARKLLRELPGADENLLCGEIEKASREWMILAALDDDLCSPGLAMELWQQREVIGAFLKGLQ